MNKLLWMIIRRVVNETGISFLLIASTEMAKFSSPLYKLHGSTIQTYSDFYRGAAQLGQKLSATFHSLSGRDKRSAGAEMGKKQLWSILTGPLLNSGGLNG